MAQELDQTNVFVKYLPAELDDDGLRDLFSPYGDVISCKVMIDHQTGSTLGYGFVRFAQPEEAQSAIQQLSGQRVSNKHLLCKLSNSSPNMVSPELSTNLYIKPLLISTTEDDLRDMFEKFGLVAAVKVMVDKLTGKSRQIGFVRFENQEDATVALNSMNGLKLAEDQPKLTVRYAETEEQRIIRKARGIPSPQSPQSPPSSPTFFYTSSQQQVAYGSVQYMPVYTNYMVSFPPQSYCAIWRPPYVLAAVEPAISY